MAAGAVLRAHLAGQGSSKEARKAGAEGVTGRRRRDLKGNVAQCGTEGRSCRPAGPREPTWF